VGTDSKQRRKRRRINAKRKRHLAPLKSKWRVKDKPIHPTGV
jgi:hypothetical protein